MKFTRREFVKTSAAASCALASGTIVVGCGNAVEPAPLLDVPGRAATLLATGAIHVHYLDQVKSLVNLPDLDPKTGGAAITLRLTQQPSPLPVGYPNPPPSAILLIQTGPLTFRATDSACPHQGCPLGYSKRDTDPNGVGFIECPCHASRFAAGEFQTLDGRTNYCEGDVIHPPAKAGLAVYTASYDASTGDVIVDLTRRISSPSVTPCAGKYGELPPIVGGKLVLPFAIYPALQSPGGAIIGVPKGATMNPILVGRRDLTSAFTVDVTCTHLGCPVTFEPQAGDLFCACHGSIFTLAGAVVNGPATIPLTSYVTALNANDVTVTIP